MPRRGSMIAYIRRDDSDPTYPTVLVPGSWALVRESDGWATVYPLGREGSSFVAGQTRNHSDVYCHVWLGFSHATLARGCFVVCGHPFVLQYLADRIAADGLPWTQSWATLAALRADAGTTATAIKAAWRNGTVELPGRIFGFGDDDGEG